MLTLNKHFIVMDMQDVCDYWTGNRKDIIEFILNMWGPEHFETEEEENAFYEEIEMGNIERLLEALQGLDYTLFCNEEERQEWLIEVGLDEK